MKVLIIGLNWVGDIIMSFPAIKKAAQSAGNRVDVVTRPHLSYLYSLNPSVDRIWEIDNRLPFWKTISNCLRVRKQKYDLIITLPGSFRSAFSAFLCGGNTRTGFKGEFRGLLLNRAFSLPELSERRHESELYSNLVELSGLSGADTFLRPPLLDENHVESVLSKYGLSTIGNFVVIAPGAAYGEAKRWPVDRFANLAEAINRRYGFFVIATGVANESNLTARVVANIGNQGIDLGGKTTLEDMTFIISRARLLVANNSGTMHLGAMLDIPLVVPMGPTDMIRTGPMTCKAVLLKGKACAPRCKNRVCTRPDHPCMTSISVASAMDGVMNLLEPNAVFNGSDGTIAV